MLYLAQVQKNLLRSSIVKLIAVCNPSSVWSACNEEIPLLSEYNNLNDGVLVLVELSSKKKINEMRDCNPGLVAILESLSQKREESIKQQIATTEWRQSLEFQARVLRERQQKLDIDVIEFEAAVSNQTRIHERQKLQMEWIDKQIENIKKEKELIEKAWEELRDWQERAERFQQEEKLIVEKNSSEATKHNSGKSNP